MRFLMALSGGVDSAVAAARLQRQGHELIGVHLRTGVEADGEAAGGSRSCCGADDARDARQVAAMLGIPFYVVDVEGVFAGVIDAFVKAYAEGNTPNPCVICNKTVKFGRLREIAHSLGAERVATGHYARTAVAPTGRQRLLRAVDPRKDQSYVLYALDQSQLAAASFPLGESAKDDVRVEAAELGFPVAGKPDSQDLCFVPRGDYREYLREHAPNVLVPGDVVDETGSVVGQHSGAAGFTVGQRRGLPALGERRYVSDVDARGGRVTIAPRGALLMDRVWAFDMNWIDEPAPTDATERRVEVKVRSASPAVAATLITGTTEGDEGSGGTVSIVFDEPIFAPAPGQAVVAYVDQAVLCGGVLGGTGPVPDPGTIAASGRAASAKTPHPGPMEGRA